MLLNAVLPMRQKAPIPDTAVDEVGNSEVSDQNKGVNASIVGETERCPPVPSTLPDRTTSASEVTEVMCTQNPSILTQAESYDCNHRGPRMNPSLATVCKDEEIPVETNVVPASNTPDVNTGIASGSKVRTGLQAAFGLAANEFSLQHGKRLGDPGTCLDPPPLKKGKASLLKLKKVYPQLLPSERTSTAVKRATVDRPKQSGKRPSKFLDYVPPADNKPRAEMCEPLQKSKVVWILHPDHQNKTIGLRRCGLSWRSYKKKLVPGVENVSWKHGMQQVTIEHVYPKWSQSKVLYPDLQCHGINTIGDALKGDFAVDATILWHTRYLNYVEVSKVN
ncbi:hypothetical protein KC19_VG107800 [Ceratodon purpureus]|uniref:Uncharacterized protein n=1 Tax=Ceratodon purpureus TaxID=3225 RepID=A0A8T0HP28_CERPU|nr:hypothetical protein KC19_VG107800 [Ceratodon purpureus]